MADAITELTASWVPNQGVQLNWTAADDATTGSSYIVYVLTNTDQVIPTWSVATKLGANVSHPDSGYVAEGFCDFSRVLLLYYCSHPHSVIVKRGASSAPIEQAQQAHARR